MRTTIITFMALTMMLAVGCGSKTGAQPAAAKTDPAAPAAMSNLPKLWDFWATWCPPCKELKPVIEGLEQEYAGKIEIKSIDVDVEKDLASKFKIQAVPTLVFLDKGGKELARIVGAVPKDTIVGRFKSLGFIQ